MDGGIKDWVRELSGKPNLADEAILLMKTPENGIRIILLDSVCCRPSIEIKKQLKDITKEDIQHHQEKFLHHHA
jgi:hypothetical protein